MEAAEEAKVEEKAWCKAERLKKKRERRREEKRKRGREIEMQGLVENSSRRIVDKDVEMTDENTQPTQNFVQTEDEEMVSDSRKGFEVFALYLNFYYKKSPF